MRAKTAANAVRAAQPPCTRPVASRVRPVAFALAAGAFGLLRADTAAVTITPPSADWNDKTLPVEAETKTLEGGNWSPYANGGNDYKQTLGSRTAFVAAISADTPEAGETATTASSIIYPLGAADGNNTTSGFDVYTVLTEGTIDKIIGLDVTSKRAGFTGGFDLLTQLEGNATVNYVWASGYGGVVASSTASYLTGDTGVTVKGSAKVLGSIVGGWVAAASNLSRNSVQTGNASVTIKNVQDSNSATAVDSMPNNYIVGGGASLGLNGGSGQYEGAELTGNSSVVIDIADEAVDAAGATFVKSVVGGPAFFVNNNYAGRDRTQIVQGGSSVEISAPTRVTFTGNIYGGGSRVNTTRNSVQVKGNAAVTINGGTYTGTLLAGGNNGASVGGTATLTINGGVFNGATLGGGTATGQKTLAFTANVDVSSSTIKDFNAITISDGKEVIIASSQESMFTAQGITVEVRDGTYVATSLIKYYWAGTSEANNNWSNPENWRKGEAKEATTTVPTEDDLVYFADTSDVLVDTDTCAAAIVNVDADVTFTGNPLNTSSIKGTGVITLGNGGGFAIAETTTIANTINVTASSENPALLTNVTSGIGFSLTGALTGEGHLRLAGEAPRHSLSGNNSAFGGTIEILKQSTSLITKPSAASAGAHWIVDMDSTAGGNFIANNDKNNVNTYQFGTLTGTVRSPNANSHYPARFEIGAQNRAGETMKLTFRGVTGSGQTFRYDYIKMVGLGTLSLDADRVQSYELASGTIELLNNANPNTAYVFSGGAVKFSTAFTADPSAQFLFTDGVTAIVDDGGSARTFATAIGNETSGGFTKRGAGSLTLSATPTYTGGTTVEAGTLITPAAPGGAYTLAASGAALQLTDSADGVTLTIPADFFGEADAYGRAVRAVKVASGTPTFVFQGSRTRDWSAVADADGWYTIKNARSGLGVILR